MKFKFITFFIILFFHFCICCNGLSVTQENIADSNAFTACPYKWIEQDKMRAGYLYYYNPVSKINLVKELGLNTIIVKCWQFGTTKERLNTIKSISDWAKAAKENKIHLFVAINWQPYPRTQGVGYKLIVYDDGTSGVAVNPFDNNFWKNQIQDIFSLIATLSIQPDLQIDGVFLDMEIYGSEKEPNIRRDYYEKKCGFGDKEFSLYLISKGYMPQNFPAVKLEDRKSWLEKENFLDDYFLFLRSQIQSLAEDLRVSTHKINPLLLMGMYPHPAKNNWVQYPLAKGLSNKDIPLVVFGIHSYGYYLDKNGDGYTFIPEDIKMQYKDDGINCLYSAGYLFYKYNSKTLEKNLLQTLEKWDGYWIWKLPHLWDEQPKGEKLIDSVEDLKKAVNFVNTKNDANI